MNIQIIPKAQQGYGAFNGGEIIENKPIGFPQDHASIRPYSNLFYWAHAKAVTDSTIGLHPHQGFEICSFILKGQIRHYDTKLKDWRALEAGDVQIIRAGAGISHAEFMARDAEMFQIWFDPNLDVTLAKPASYDDYRAADFPKENPSEGVEITTLAGGSSPFRMDTPGIVVRRATLNGATHVFDLAPGQMLSVYVLEGSVALGDAQAGVSDFALVKDASSFSVSATGQATLFMIESPVQPGYATYAKRFTRRA